RALLRAPGTRRVGPDLPPTFLVPDKHGNWTSYLYQTQPIARAATRVAFQVMAHGPKEVVQAMIFHSDEFVLINQALNDRKSLEDLRAKPTQIVGVLAEELGEVGRV